MDQIRNEKVAGCVLRQCKTNHSGKGRSPRGTPLPGVHYSLLHPRKDVFLSNGTALGKKQSILKTGLHTVLSVASGQQQVLLYNLESENTPPGREKARTLREGPGGPSQC